MRSAGTALRKFFALMKLCRRMQMKKQICVRSTASRTTVSLPWMLLQGGSHSSGDTLTSPDLSESAVNEKHQQLQKKLKTQLLCGPNTAEWREDGVHDKTLLTIVKRAPKSRKTEEARKDWAVCGNRWQINHAAWIYAPLLPDPPCSPIWFTHFRRHPWDQTRQRKKNKTQLV